MAASVTLFPRPSAAGRWGPPSGCPGSVQMESHFPDDQSESTREGIAAHEVLEISSNGLGITHVFVGQQMSNGVVVTDDMAEYVQEVVDACKGDDTWSTEHTIPIPSVHPLQTGTVDKWTYVHNGGILRIRDFKYGWGIVEPEENWQLLDYASGLVGIMGGYPVNKISLEIHQPRAPHPAGRLRTWEITLGQLQDYTAHLASRAALAMTSQPPLQTGPHCRDCQALRACPMAREAALNAISVSGLMMLETYTGQEMANEKELLNAASIALEQRKKAIDNLVEDELKQGRIVPGWTTETAYGRTKWRPGTPDEMFVAWEELLGRPLTKPKPITPNQMKKAGVPQSLIDAHKYTPETGVKVVRGDASETAKRIFGDV